MDVEQIELERCSVTPVNAGDPLLNAMGVSFPPLTPELMPRPTSGTSVSNWRRWWRAPLWFAALFTGAKSFADNPILGSRRLNRAGLHMWRLRAAHWVAGRRRARLAAFVLADERASFERDGFVVVRDFLPAEQFDILQSALLEHAFETRSQQQGDTITRRVAVGAELRRRLPELSALIRSSRWKNLLAYVGGLRAEPIYYLQTILGGVAAGAADPQVHLHSDTFQPSLKAWLFLTDVADDGRPLTYVAGSHRLTPDRLAWEHRKSCTVLDSGDRLSQRGSFRVHPSELPDLGLPPPTRFAVPANTLVVADTCGFHARADADHPTMRVELWAFSRPAPFFGWNLADLFAWAPIAARRADIFAVFMDWLDRRGWAKQHWLPSGLKRALEP